MDSKLPSGFHQALVSAAVFLTGTTLAYLKLFVVDSSSERWSFFSAISALAAILAMILQIVTLYRALQIENDEPRTFSATVRVLMSSMGCLIASGLSLAVAQWWQPLSALTNWMNN